MRGGYRENAGRKIGYSAIEAEKAREYIVRRVQESLEPIVNSMIERAIKGDLKASQLLFDRAYGKPLIPFEGIGEAPMMIRLDI
ncbi:MAG: hypothetical protein AAB446_00620 [Patescibacteria group bacterium]